MEKTSALKQPIPKKARVETPTTLTKSLVKRTSNPLSSNKQDEVEENDLPTTQSQKTSEKNSKSSSVSVHPSGHKVSMLSKVWTDLDNQSFLPPLDTLNRADVYVMPMKFEPGKGTVVNVTLMELVFGRHIKRRIAVTKMSVDDLLKMCYLNDKMQWIVEGFTVYDYDDWLNDKTAACVKYMGRDASDQQSVLGYLLNEEHVHECSFYPKIFRGNVGVFFRKICVHSYKAGEDTEKLENPAIFKCHATRGKFEYVIQAYLIVLPMNWYTADVDGKPAEGEEEEDLPATQPMDM